MNYLIIKKVLIFSLLFISGCQVISPKLEQAFEHLNTTASSVSSDECPEQPNIILNTQNVQAIALEDKQATLSGIARKNHLVILIIRSGGIVSEKSG